MNELISVIVPVYNMEKYIERCISSLIKQTYTNIEIIIVDYGSTDGSNNLCNHLAKRDKRIKVFHKKNGGLSDARNFGLEHSSGQYIGFVDSDDFIDKKMYEILMKNMLQNNSDISICNFSIISKNTFKVKPEKNIKVFSKNDAMRELMLGNYFQSQLCNKLFKRKLFEGIKFPVNKWYEDVYIIPLLFHNSNSVVWSNYYGYAYFKRKESITNCFFNEQHFTWLEAIETIKKFYKSNYPDYIIEIENVFIFANLLLIRKMYRIKHYNKKTLQILRNNILKNYKEYLRYRGKTSYNTFINKCEIIIFKYFPSLYRLIILTHRYIKNYYILDNK